MRGHPAGREIVAVLELRDRVVLRLAHDGEDGQAGRVDADIGEAYDAEMYTLALRLRWFPSVEFAYTLAVATTLLWSGILAYHHVIGIGAATSDTIYAVALMDPVDRVISWLDELQVGESAVVSEGHVTLSKRVGVLVGACTGGCVTDVGHERG